MLSEFVDTITPFLYQHRYIFAFLGAFFEGNTIMLLAGFLYKLGLFKFWNILAVLIAGYVLNGYGLYALGRFSGEKLLNKWGNRFLGEERLAKLRDYFERHTAKALIITRITYGLSTYMFVIAGIFRTKAKKFFWCNLIAAVMWVLMMFGIGYSFGASYEALSRVVRIVAAWLVVALFIVIVSIAIGIVFWLRKKARVKFIEKILNQEGWKKLKWLGEKIYEFLNKDISIDNNFKKE